MTDDSIRNKLSGSEFFSGFDQGQIDLIAANAQPKSFSSGQVVFKQGDHAERFFLLLSGKLLVEIPSVYGPSITIQNLQAGHILGWSWLIPPYEWDFQARVEEDSDMLEFNGKALLEYSQNNPEFGYKLLMKFTVLMSQRLHAARQRMMDEWNPAGFA